jgi:hypothetical protein
MIDLAQAIVDLGKAAQLRTGARRELVKSTSTVAAAIRRHLRTEEDQAWVDDALNPHAVANGDGPIYVVRRFRTVAGELQSALCRDDAILEEIDLGNIDGDDVGVHKATARERRCFAKEAPTVVAEFEVELRRDAEEFSEAARAVTKLVVR